MQGQRGSLGREHNSSISSHFLHSLVHAGYPRGCCHTVLCLRRLYPCYCSTFLRRFDLAQRSLLFFRILDTTSHLTQEEITLHFGTSRPRPSCCLPSDTTSSNNCVNPFLHFGTPPFFQHFLKYLFFSSSSISSPEKISNRSLISWNIFFRRSSGASLIKMLHPLPLVHIFDVLVKFLMRFLLLCTHHRILFRICHQRRLLSFDCHKSSAAHLLHLDENILPLSGQICGHSFDDDSVPERPGINGIKTPGVTVQHQFPLLILVQVVLLSFFWQKPVPACSLDAWLRSLPVGTAPLRTFLQIAPHGPPRTRFDPVRRRSGKAWDAFHPLRSSQRV